jgi:hypothetical protein
MGDYDRDGTGRAPGEPIREPARERETVRDTDRTTIIQTDRGERSGGSGVLMAVILLLAVLAIAFFFFRGSFNRAANDVGVNVNVPAASLPDVNLKVPDKVKIDIPDNVKIDTGSADGNKAK